MPADGPDTHEIERALRERRRPFARHPGPTNLIVELADSWDEYLTALDSKRRTKVRRILKEFEGLPQADYVMAEEPRETVRTWQELRTLHNLHWKAEGRQGVFESITFDAFHSELVGEYLRRGMLVLGSLRVNGAAVAACYAIRLGQTVYEYQRGHDPAWINKRPGHALQFHLFARVMRMGVRRWDYLRGDYPHKRDWATAQRATTSFVIPSRRLTMVSRFYLEETLRKTRRRLGQWRRQAKALTRGSRDAARG